VVIPFETPPVTAQWGRTITYEDYNKMLQGYRPDSMDDKWFVKTNKPEDAQGDIVVHAYWGWSSHEMIALTVTAGDPSKTDAKEWATITQIAWRKVWPGSEEEMSEAKAKRNGVGFCNHLLKCSLEEEDEEEDEEDDDEDDKKEDNHDDKDERKTD
jgi:hypothetical protein